jgi:hypothetical protein
MDDGSQKFLLWVGHLGAVLGVVICALAVLSRQTGAFEIMDLRPGAVFEAGIATMVLGCLGYLALLVRRETE